MYLLNYWQALRDYRSCCLLLACLALLGVFIKPFSEQNSPRYNYTFVVDITRSMNAVDYQAEGQAISRLEFVKQQLRQLLHQLPCSTKVGLGVFTERRSTLLFEPLNICENYAELDTAISKVDWRMAWAADSHIAKGLLNTLEMLQKSDNTIVFITDGQEAPPVNPAYQPDLRVINGKVKGLIVGAGGLKAVPIPKFDDTGKLIGVYKADDVPHRTSFGQSNLDPSQIDGYDARNAPFGRKAATGYEHLSALQESYLQQLAQDAGLSYTRLSDLDHLFVTLQQSAFAKNCYEQVDIRWCYALFALTLLSFSYLPLPRLQNLFLRFTNMRSHQYDK